MDDPALPGARVGRRPEPPGWRLRDECITRLLFESGCRVSEIIGLTLTDSAARGTLQEATTLQGEPRCARQVHSFFQRNGQAATAIFQHGTTSPRSRNLHVRISSGATLVTRPTCSSALSAARQCVGSPPSSFAKHARHPALPPPASTPRPSGTPLVRHNGYSADIRDGLNLMPGTSPAARVDRVHELAARYGERSRHTSIISIPPCMPRYRTACTRVWTRRCGRPSRSTTAVPRSRPPVRRPSPPDPDGTSPSGRTSLCR